MSGHWITWTLDTWGVNAVIRCDEPAGADAAPCPRPGARRATGRCVIRRLYLAIRDQRGDTSVRTA